MTWKMLLTPSCCVAMAASKKAKTLPASRGSLVRLPICTKTPRITIRSTTLSKTSWTRSRRSVSDRCKVDNIAAGPTLVSVDPRLEAMYRKATEIVGIDGPKNELVKRLMNEDSTSLQQPKIISIVGFGGLGKTTLALALLQDLKAKFDCHFFVSVSFNPDIKKILKNILVQLDENKYSHIDEAWEINLLINKIIDFLKNKRYSSMLYLLFIVVNKYFPVSLSNKIMKHWVFST